VNQVLNALNENSILISDALGSLSVTEIDSTSAIQDAETNAGMNITHTTHPFYRFMLNNVAPQVNSSGFSFSMNASYAFSDQVTFTTKPYQGTEMVLTWNAPIYLLSHNHVQGITVNQYPWNVDLSSFSMQGANQ